MISIDDAQTVLSRGGSVLSADGEGVGTIGSVYLDDSTGNPAWASVSNGSRGGDAFVPLAGGRVDGNDLWVPCTRQQIDGAPQVNPTDGRLSPEDDAALHRYYDGAGRSEDAQVGAAGSAAGAGSEARGVEQGRGTAPSGTDDGSMIRSEEQLRVRTERVPVTRVRLRKVVVTENVTQTVPVSHEELRLEEVPFDAVDGDDVVPARGGAPAGDASNGFEVVLREERIVVTKQVAAVERVRVRVETVAGESRVTAELKKERVVADETKASDLR